MYSRNRQSQAYANVRSQNNAPNSGSFQNANPYPQGNYPPSQSSGNQQGNYKQGNGQNPQPFKQQQHGQPKQNVLPRPPQHVIAQQQTQLQQQQQQPSTNPTPTSQRLKPILKQTSQNVMPTSSSTVTQNSNTPLQPAASIPPPISVPVPAPTSVPPSTPDPISVSTPTPTTASIPMSTNNTIEANPDVAENMDIDPQEPPKWRRKVPGFKVNKKLKRLRLNQRLRKTLQPKNAIMVLNEMKAGVQFTFPETQGNMPSSLYLVHAELDGKTYVGQGLSKPLARQNAAENALKALLLEKMTAATMKARIDAETDGQPNQTADSSVIAKEEAEEMSSTGEVNIEENEEIPWSSLASFALYKLFLEWHNQGTSVPVPRPGLPSPTKGIKREITQTKAPVQKELPPNATSIHPVMLLNQMRPGLTYVELHRAGNPPNTMFTLAVNVDGVEYTGTAKNKKDAKKIAAKAALLALYNLSYPEEMRVDVPTEEVQLG